jgi:site-specific DNA-methyltransferase (adenine-specific)
MISKFENKIINADCMDILRQLPDKCIDLVLTDPPYGIGADKGFGRSLRKNDNIIKKEWDKDIPCNEVFQEIQRVSRSQIIWGGNYFPCLWLASCRGYIVWDKMNGGRDFADCEMAWTSFDTVARLFQKRIVGSIPDRFHPTQKPLSLFEWCLQNYSKEGDLVLDCFSGSGTTAVACWNLKRRFICIEKNFDYWAASVRRLEEAQRQMRLF